MVSRKDIYQQTLSEIPPELFVQGDSLDSLLSVIIPESNKVILFSDYHGDKFPVDLLLGSLPFLAHHGYNQFMLEMLPMRDAPYTSIDEIMTILTSSGWSSKPGEVKVIDSCHQLAVKCSELGIEIIGGDIVNYAEMHRTGSIAPRYKMNEVIAERIAKNVREGKKVISFFGVEHNNTRTRNGHPSFDNHLGIPFYLGDVPYLVIKDVRMSNRTDYLTRLLPPGYVALKTEPVVDYPHFFIKVPTEDAVEAPSAKKQRPTSEGGRKRSIRKKRLKRKSKRYHGQIH